MAQESPDKANISEESSSRVFSFSPLYRRYVLAVLTLIYFVSCIDRILFSILLQSVKTDLGLSDTQLGILSGFAFAIFYATLGIPIAQLADRFNRRNIIVICITLWSVMTAACGLAKNFPMLLLARVGVGIGEAGSSPASHSIISDYFPPKKRATALAIFGCGAPLSAIGFVLGGRLNELVGWRETFLIVGLPGVLVGLLALLTLREPPRGHADGITETTLKPDLRQSLSYLLKNSTFRYLCLAMSLQSFVIYSLLSWLPAFFERTHSLGSGEIGLKLGLGLGIGGVVGMLPGGMIADRLAVRNLRWYSRVGAVSLLLATPCVALTLLSTDPNHCFIAFAFAAGFLNGGVGSMYTILQGIAPLGMRASAPALLFLVVHLIGVGVGPVLIGALTDIMAASHGADSLKASLMVLIVMPSIAAILFWLSAKEINRNFIYPRSNIS